jgi:protein TonB
MARRLSTLQIALLASIGVHAALLAVRFADPQGFERFFQDTPLEVILVNARTHEKPTKAQAVAQASLAGGGEAESGRATSPLPAAAIAELGDSSDEAHRQIEELQEEQQQLLAQIQRSLAALPPPDPKRDMGQQQARDTEEKRRQLLKLLAEIEKRINEENARPKKRYISPATREEAYAMYYDHMRRKIEERGTRDFPQAGGKKLYGELMMNVTIDSQGRVVDAQVVRPSKSKMLDKRAVAIVHASEPFGSFTPQMRQQADQIVITSRFRFTREDGLETTLSAPDQ